MLKDMEERDIIEQSTAAWLSPIVLVNKPDGSKRMCLDYRQVNKHLATDIYPLPRLEELVDQAGVTSTTAKRVKSLGRDQYYVTLDMREAYFQLMLDEDSWDLTIFSHGVTLYRFKQWRTYSIWYPGRSIILHPTSPFFIRTERHHSCGTAGMKRLKYTSKIFSHYFLLVNCNSFLIHLFITKSSLPALRSSN